MFSLLCIRYSAFTFIRPDLPVTLLQLLPSSDLLDVSPIVHPALEGETDWLPDVVVFHT